MRPTTPHAVAFGLILLAIAIGGSGCAVTRTTGPGRPLDTYDYCVISNQGAHKYYDTATRALDQSFVILNDSDPRLELPRVRQKAAVATIDWTPGFWSSSGWMELKDYSYGTHIHTSHMRRGMFWTGAHEDVLEAIRDVAAARAAGPALPADARDPAPDTQGEKRSTAQRLEELNDLKLQGLITQKEYDARRKSILADQ